VRVNNGTGYMLQWQGVSSDEWGNMHAHLSSLFFFRTPHPIVSFCTGFDCNDKLQKRKFGSSDPVVITRNFSSLMPMHSKYERNHPLHPPHRCQFNIFPTGFAVLAIIPCILAFVAIGWKQTFLVFSLAVFDISVYLVM
jgi:hypothetical protein